MLADREYDWSSERERDGKQEHDLHRWSYFTSDGGGLEGGVRVTSMYTIATGFFMSVPPPRVFIQPVQRENLLRVPRARTSSG